MKKLRCTMNVCLISHQAQNGRFSNTGTLVSKFTEVRFHRTVLPQLSVFAFLYYRKYSIINISKDMRRQLDVRSTRCITYK